MLAAVRPLGSPARPAVSHWNALAVMDRPEPPPTNYLGGGGDDDDDDEGKNDAQANKPFGEYRRARHCPPPPHAARARAPAPARRAPARRRAPQPRPATPRPTLFHLLAPPAPAAPPA